jgi:8-oxo-dGTP pyrophosphatase MutT (NUDIX family)
VSGSRGWHDAAMVPPRWPVSIKGVVLWDDAVVLVHNERDEWELLGGRLDEGETPEQCVVREIAEELGFVARPEQLLDTWVYEVVPGRRVFIVTFGCSAERPGGLPVRAVNDLAMPEGYRASIRRWSEAHSAGSPSA